MTSKKYSVGSIHRDIIKIIEYKTGHNLYVNCLNCNSFFNTASSNLEKNKMPCQTCRKLNPFKFRMFNGTKICIGDKYDKLKVLDFIREPWAKAVCICDCGNVTKKLLAGLLTDKNINCGCDTSKNYYGIGDLYPGYLGNIKTRARKKNLEFNINLEYIYNLFIKQQGLCAITKQPIILKRLNRYPESASLDRIDSSLGYIQGNLQWVDKEINWFKSNFEIIKFIELCKNVTFKPMNNIEVKLPKMSNKFRGYGYIYNNHFNLIKRYAEQRNINFTLEIKELSDLYESQNGHCALSGLPILIETSVRRNASLDRIDSSKHYTIDNIQWVDKTINILKKDYSEEEFFKMCKLVAENN